MAHIFKIKCQCVLRCEYPLEVATVCSYWHQLMLFPSVHLTIVTNLHNRPKNPGRWIPKKNWSRLPLSKRRELCTLRYVNSCISLSSQEIYSRVNELCWYSLLWILSVLFWIRVSLNFYKSVISNIRNDEKEWINVTKEYKCLFYRVYSRL